MNAPERICGTCRWWGLSSNRALVDGAYRACERVRMREQFPQDGPLAVSEDPAFVEDGSGYYAAIRCRADFGCVLWEAAP